MTLSTRPSVSGPTGTITGWPRLSAFIPRTRPSVGCSAMVRTRPSPMCCCASQMMSMGSGTLKPSLVTRMAVWTRGMWPSGNSQSTAGPDTWTTLPNTTSTLVVAIRFLFYSEAQAMGPRHCLLGDCGATYHFDDFFGDAGLAHAIHIQSQGIDDVAGVGGGRVHRGHARGVLGRSGFEQCAVDFHLDVSGQQRFEHDARGLLKNVIDGGLLRFHFHWQHTRKGDLLRHDAFEFVVE